MCKTQSFNMAGGAWSALKKPKQAKPPPAPTPPDPAPRAGDATMMKAIEDERRRQVQQGQRNSTNLTGAQGLTGPAATTKKTTSQAAYEIKNHPPPINCLNLACKIPLIAIISGSFPSSS